MVPRADRARRRRRFASYGLPVLLVVVSWGIALDVDGALRSPAAPLRAPDPRPPARDFQDLAVACLVSGESTPSLDELDGGRVDSVVRVLARVFEAYMEADFGAYLRLHREDLAWASRARASDVGTLARIMERDLGHPAADVPAEWTAAVELFWRLLYPSPVLRTVFPESARFDLRTEDLEGGATPPDLEAFWEPFERVRFAHKRRINHEFAVPHRRSVETIAFEEGSLTWFDFQVDVELGEEERLPGSLLLRFVWDGVDGDWFLARAVTIYPDHVVPGETRNLLLF